MGLPEIYVSTDVEMDGPIPGAYSMLSLGAAAFTKEKELIDTFSVNLETLPDAGTHPDTMQWWETQPDAWSASRIDPQPPKAAMQAFARWVRALPGKPVFVAYPVANDFLFVQWYLHTFTGDSPFGYNALDIRSYAMAVLKQPFHESGKDYVPKEWLEPGPLSHMALDDAINQGRWFCNMLEANLNNQSISRRNE